MKVQALFRFPVKSMQGERLDEAELTTDGVAGDRAYAVVDTSDGRVVTAKHPRKWARILELAARYDDGPDGPVTIELPDGATVRSGEPGVDDALSAFLGGAVALTTGPNDARKVEEVWPADVEGLAPMDLVEGMDGAHREEGDLVTDIPLASMAPGGRYFDLTTLHVLTDATLAELGRLAPASDFDVRRYRPNVLVTADATGFVENDWVGATLAIGSAEARVDLPTMRCVLTTMAQPGLAADRETLRTVARHNRVTIPGMGTWACAGVYASVTGAGTVRVGDPVVMRR